MINEFDKQRIENAIWTLFQYQNDIRNMASEMKLDEHEIGAMFRTLIYVEGNVIK